MNSTLLVSLGISLALTSIAALSAITAAIFLYKWRIRTKEGDGVIIVQDEFYHQIQVLYEKITTLEKKVASNESQSKAIFDSLEKNTAENLNRIQNHLESIEKIADERSKEIERFREGHDYVKFKIFIKSIIYLIDEVSEEVEQLTEEEVEDTTREKFENVMDELIILLDNNSVEQIIPPIGSPYSIEDRQYKRIKKCFPEKESQANTIKNIGKPGYQLILGNENPIVIRPAEVVVYGSLKEEGK